MMMTKAMTRQMSTRPMEVIVKAKASKKRCRRAISTVTVPSPRQQLRQQLRRRGGRLVVLLGVGEGLDEEVEVVDRLAGPLRLKNGRLC
jgi:hypothetical protein